jgi:hypothetical protein
MALTSRKARDSSVTEDRSTSPGFIDSGTVQEPGSGRRQCGRRGESPGAGAVWWQEHQSRGGTRRPSGFPGRRRSGESGLAEIPERLIRQRQRARHRRFDPAAMGHRAAGLVTGGVRTACMFVGRKSGWVQNLLGGNASFRREAFDIVGLSEPHRSLRWHPAVRSVANRRSFASGLSRLCPNSAFIFDARSVIWHRYRRCAADFTISARAAMPMGCPRHGHPQRRRRCRLVRRTPLHRNYPDAGQRVAWRMH